MTFAEQPSLVADHAFTTGQVPGVTFEKVLSPSKMKVGVEHGHGCYADRLPEDERSQAAIPDQFRHEIATAYNLKGKGLVVLTSCSHRGVVNIVKQAQAASGVSEGARRARRLPSRPVQGGLCAPGRGGAEGDRSRLRRSRCTARASRSTRSPRPRCRTKLLRSFTGTRFVFNS